MSMENIRLIKELLANLNLEVITSGYLRCYETWGDIDYTPDYSKLYFILDGEGWLRIDGTDYYPQQNGLYLMPQGVLQSFGNTNMDNRLLKYWVHFNASVGDVNLFDLIECPCYVNVKDVGYITGMFNQLTTGAGSDGLTSSLMAKAALNTILSYFIDNIDSIALKKTAGLDRLSEVIRHIDLHLTDDITIDSLAAIACLHPNYFIRYFKKHTGISPITFINKRRIEKAKRLLAAGGMVIKQIADETGFKNEFYFSKSFKKLVGLSPSEYRSKSNI